ncbi:hypothetical protein MRB53_025612 [Persea americana]|uniref:Uncharacterized protein n=1 Tax=Persea americana TaxID=3435 RepID=A0ACC2LFP7_PERAE|nr:hypothetical protein MRB53_025612 [Persea americana]
MVLDVKLTVATKAASPISTASLILLLSNMLARSSCNCLGRSRVADDSVKGAIYNWLGLVIVAISWFDIAHGTAANRATVSNLHSIHRVGCEEFGILDA